MTTNSHNIINSQDQTQALALVTPSRRPPRQNHAKFGRHQPHSASTRFLSNQLTLPVIGEDSIVQTDLVKYADCIEEVDNELLKRKNEARNTVIAYYYRYVLQAPSEAFWEGKDGVLSVKCVLFKISTGNEMTF